MDSQNLALGLGVVAFVVVYAGACRFWPFAACWRCEGTGKRRSPRGKAWRTCPRCKGAGKRRRFGVVVLDMFGDRRVR